MAYRQGLCTAALLSFDEMALSLQLDDFQPEDGMASLPIKSHASNCEEGWWCTSWKATRECLHCDWFHIPDAFIIIRTYTFKAVWNVIVLHNAISLANPVCIFTVHFLCYVTGATAAQKTNHKRISRDLCSVEIDTKSWLLFSAGQKEKLITQTEAWKGRLNQDTKYNTSSSSYCLSFLPSFSFHLYY